jgi:hypothetical protein
MLTSPPAIEPRERVRTIELEKLTWAEAKRLEGQPVRVSFVCGLPFIFDKDILMFVKGNTGIRCWFTYPLSEGFEFKKKMVVEGIVRTRSERAHIVDGKEIPDARYIDVNEAHVIRP